MSATSYDERRRWGEDWLLALMSALGSENAAEAGGAPGLSLSAALRLLEAGSPAPAPRAEAVRRAGRILVAIDRLAARGVARAERLAQRRWRVESARARARGERIAPFDATAIPPEDIACCCALTLTPVEARRTPDGMRLARGGGPIVRAVPAPSPRDRDQLARATWLPWKAGSLPGSEWPRAATLADLLLDVGGDDVFIHLFLGLRGTGDGGLASAARAIDPLADESDPAVDTVSTAITEVCASRSTRIRAGSSWIMPRAVPDDGTPYAADAFEQASHAEEVLSIRPYATPLATDAELRLRGQLAAAIERGLAVALIGRDGRSRSWSGIRVDDGAPCAATLIAPLRIFPRASDGTRPVLARMHAIGTAAAAPLIVVDLAAAAAARVTAAAAGPRDDASTPADAPARKSSGGTRGTETPGEPFVDCWGVPRDADAIATFADGIAVRAHELVRDNRSFGNVRNKLRLLADHGWTLAITTSGAGDAADAAEIWVSPAPLVIVGTDELKRFIARFGSNLTIEHPLELRRWHLESAYERFTRFAELSRPTPQAQPVEREMQA